MKKPSPQPLSRVAGEGLKKAFPVSEIVRLGLFLSPLARYAGEGVRVLDKARTLRHQPTPAETQLWQCLRNRQLSGYKFRRQYPVGEYIADFACITAGLIIELDGNHHADQEQRAYDDVRTLFLQTAGFRILRFWNNQILDDLPTVLQTIEHSLRSPSPVSRERGLGGEGNP